MRIRGVRALTQGDLRRIKAEYFPGLDPAQIALYIYGEQAPHNRTLVIERVLSEAGLRKRLVGPNAPK